MDNESGTSSAPAAEPHRSPISHAASLSVTVCMLELSLSRSQQTHSVRLVTVHHAHSFATTPLISLQDLVSLVHHHEDPSSVGESSLEAYSQKSQWAASYTVVA
jgi:hypothetical protein